MYHKIKSQTIIIWSCLFLIILILDRLFYFNEIWFYEQSSLTKCFLRWDVVKQSQSYDLLKEKYCKQWEI